MVAIPGTVLGAKIVPSDTADTYPVFDEQYGICDHVTATTTTRNAIPVARLKVGQRALVLAGNKTYQLKTGFANPTVDADWLDVTPVTTDNVHHEIYYDTTGNDITGNGTAALPYLTVNRCLQDVASSLRNVVNIKQVTAHTHTEDIVWDKLGGYTGTVLLRGIQKNVYPTPSGVVTADSGTQRTITKAGMGLTDHAHIGQFVYVTAGGGYVPRNLTVPEDFLDNNYHVIVDNVGDTITVKENSLGTAFSATTEFKIITTDSKLVGSSGAAIQSLTDIPYSKVQLECIEVDVAFGPYGIDMRACSLWASGCTFKNTSAGTVQECVYMPSANSAIYLKGCYIYGRFSAVIYAVNPASVYLDGCVIDGTAKALSSRGLAIYGCPDVKWYNTTIGNVNICASLTDCKGSLETGTNNVFENCSYDYYINDRSNFFVIAGTASAYTSVSSGSVAQNGGILSKSSTEGNGYASDRVGDDLSKINYYNRTNRVEKYVPCIWRTASISSAAGTTNLFTVPTGFTCIVTGAIVRMTADAAHVGDLTAGIGVAAGEDDICASTVLSGLSTSNIFQYIPAGTAVTVAAGSTIKFGIDTSHTGGSSTLEVQLFYTLI